MTDVVANTGTSASNAANLASGQASLSSSYSTFLTLLTTQLQNQDPTSPMDTNTFTQQLVSMTGVQQQLLTNQLLQTMVNNSSSGSVSSAVGMIGQNVTADTSLGTLSGGQATWNYSLPTAAASATATITDPNGNVVWSGPLSGVASGNNTFTWNGQTTAGAQLADGGTYSVAITATDSSGGAITPTVSITGTVKSVQQVSGVTEVLIGATAVPVSSIVSDTGAASS
jgi:flagellar basal-body rod modification protein FlgD